jgi:hypothetical protein
MYSRKTITIFLVSAAVLISLFLLFGTGDDSATLGLAVLSGAPSDSIEVEGVLDVPHLNTSGEVNKLVIDYSRFGSPLVVGNDVFEMTGDGEIVLEGYKGAVSLTEGKVSLDGRAKRVKVNGVSINRDKDTYVSLQVDFKSLGIYGASLNSLFFPATGKINASRGKNTFTLREDWLTTGLFRGDIEVDDKFSIFGETDTFSLKGTVSVDLVS